MFGLRRKVKLLEVKVEIMDEALRALADIEFRRKFGTSDPDVVLELIVKDMLNDLTGELNKKEETKKGKK